MQMRYPYYSLQNNCNGANNGMNQTNMNRIGMNAISMQDFPFKPISLITIDISKNNSIYSNQDFINIKSYIEKSNNIDSFYDYLNKGCVKFTRSESFISFKYKSFFFMIYIGKLSTNELHLFFQINFGNSIQIPFHTYPLNSIIGICWEDNEEKVNLRDPSILFKLFQKLLLFHSHRIVFKTLDIEHFYFSKALDQWIIKNPDDFIIKENLHNLQLVYSPKNILENSSLYSERCLENEVLVSFEEIKRK